MNFKDLIPPIIVRMLEHVLFKENNHNIHKYYDTYYDALKECSEQGYENDDLCSIIALKTVSYANKLKNEKISNVNHITAFLLAAINQSINQSSLKVLDFGGACGAHYFEIKKLIEKDINLKWIVVETPKMIKTAKNRGIENEELRFIDSIEHFKDIVSKIDLIHSSGALQYVDKPYDYIQRLLKVKAKYILFDRMMFNENDRDIITVQRSSLSANGPGPLPKGFKDRIISYPHTTLSFKSFNELIEKKYEILWIFEERSGSFPLNNEKIIGGGLLYKIKWLFAISCG